MNGLGHGAGVPNGVSSMWMPKPTTGSRKLLASVSLNRDVSSYPAKSDEKHASSSARTCCRGSGYGGVLDDALCWIEEPASNRGRGQRRYQRVSSMSMERSTTSLSCAPDQRTPSTAQSHMSLSPSPSVVMPCCRTAGAVVAPLSGTQSTVTVALPSSLAQTRTNRPDGTKWTAVLPVCASTRGRDPPASG